MTNIKKFSSFKNLINEEYDELEVGTLSYWKENNKAVYDSIIEKNRDINVDFGESWYEYAYEYFINTMTKKFGWAPDDSDISFTGFYSQGDGASFEGQMDTEDVIKVLKSLPSKRLSEETEIFLDLAYGSLGVDVSFDRSGRYSHEKSVSTNLEIYVEDHDEVFNLIRESEVARKKFNSDYADDEIDEKTEYDEDEHYDAVDEFCMDLANFIEEDLDDWREECSIELYKILEDSYEGLTSDESVIDTIEANEYEFDENGDMV